MFGRDGTGMRGRNVEDLGELEEKGLLRRKSPDKESNGLSSPRLRRGQGSVRAEKEGSLERIILDEGKEGEGLTSTRDKQAFALLILLCKLLDTLILQGRKYVLITRSVSFPVQLLAT